MLDNVSFRVNSGECAGIVGPNGAGKSTIFSLICGEISPDSGSITIPGNTRLRHLRQQLNPHDVSDTLLEYVEGGMPELLSIQKKIDVLEKAFHDNQVGDKREQALKQLGELQTRFENGGGYRLRSQAEAALTGLGFKDEDFSAPFKSFSGGWQMRAELIRVLVADPQILLLDEPSNYLDVPAVEWLQHFLREFRGTLILISHDRYLLNSLTNVTIEIAAARATRYAGNYNFFVEDRKKRYELVAAGHKKQAVKRQRAERFVERFRSKNTKASLVQSKIKMLERMPVIDAPVRVVNPGSIRLQEPLRSGQEVVRLEDAGLTYDGEHRVLQHINMSIDRGDHMALVGLNGTGKTTLLKILSNQLPLSEGKRVQGHKVTIGYQSQEFAETMNPRHTVFEAAKSAGGGASDQQARSLLGGFGFSGDSVQKAVQVLSGGEKVRLAFARLLMNPPNFLILDEPTTHLDVDARKALETALSEFKGTICFVSHDIAFVRHVATSVIAMTPPGITRYWGGYDYYHDKLLETRAGVSVVPSKGKKSIANRKADRRARAEVVQSFSKQRQVLKKNINRLEKRIESLEKEQSELVRQMESSDEKNYAEINERMTALQQKLSDYNSQWEAFAIELDELEQEYGRAKRGA